MFPSEMEAQAGDTNAVQPPESELAATATDSGFHSLGLCDALIEAVESSGYTTPTPIQAQTIPLLLAGRDVLGQAQTGTGKTAAFALPLLERIDLFKKQTQLLVLTPTRELAIQVAEAFEKYAKSMRGLRVVPIYGGQDYQVQFRQLNRGVHVVVGTPGRVMDHMRRGSLNLDELQCLVLDEAGVELVVDMFIKDKEDASNDSCSGVRHLAAKNRLTQVCRLLREYLRFGDLDSRRHVLVRCSSLHPA